jgi:S-formylglutathione hydrolase
MYSYILEEFVPSIFAHFPVDQGQCGIFGFSMGGHGLFPILKRKNFFLSRTKFFLYLMEKMTLAPKPKSRE